MSRAEQAQRTELTLPSPRSIYIGSAIYTSSIPDLMATFGVSQVVATLGLTLFVFAYGIGPMIFSPMQEMPRFGRNSIYMITLLLFVVFQIPVIFAAPNFATILVFRFLAGFVGSPALATGGSSLLGKPELACRRRERT